MIGPDRIGIQNKQVAGWQRTPVATCGRQKSQGHYRPDRTVRRELIPVVMNYWGFFVI